MRAARRPATTVAAALLVLLSACAGDPNPEPDPTIATPTDPLVPGACLNASADHTDPTDADVVDCAELHDYELLARQDIPLEYLAGGKPTTQDRAQLADALSGKAETALQLKFASYARAYCTIALQRVSGLSEADFGGQSADKVQAKLMSGQVATGTHLNSGDAWLKQPLLICTAHRGEDANMFITDHRGGSFSRTLLSDEVPLDRRSCYVLDASGKEAPEFCTKPHAGEYAVSFDATPLLEDEQIATESERADRPFTRAVQRLLNDACVDTLPTLIGDDYDEDVTARAARGPSGWGDGNSVNLVECHFVPAAGTDGDLPPGSLFGIGDTNVKLVQ